jgi:hypothetical protein
MDGKSHGIFGSYEEQYVPRNLIDGEFTFFCAFFWGKIRKSNPAP